MSKHLFGTLAVLLLADAASAATATSTYREVEAKVALETSLEKRLETVLKKVLNTEDLVVILNVQMQAETESKDGEIMPGVPQQDASTAFPGLIDPSRSVVRRVAADILLDQSAGDSDVALVKATAERMLGLRPERGDKLLIEKANFRREAAAPQSAWEKYLQPQLVLSAGWLLLAAACFLWLYRNFLAPFLTTLRDLFLARQTQMNEAAPITKEETLETEKTAALPPPALAADKSGEAPQMPFSFIQESDLPTLGWMLQQETVEAAAATIHYLSTTFAARVLAFLEPARRQEVAALLGSVSELDPEQVREVERSIRSRIHYFMGGEEKLAEIISHASPQVQEQLLAGARAGKPELAERLERRIVRFEDLLLLNESDLKTLARQVPVRSLASVFKAHPELQAQIVPKLRSGLGEWLAQEIQLQGDLPAAVLEQELQRMLSVFSDLVRSGRLQLRKEASAPENVSPQPINLFRNGRPKGPPPPPLKPASEKFRQGLSALERELESIDAPKE